MVTLSLLVVVALLSVLISGFQPQRRPELRRLLKTRRQVAMNYQSYHGTNQRNEFFETTNRLEKKLMSKLESRNDASKTQTMISVPPNPSSFFVSDFNIGGFLQQVVGIVGLLVVLGVVVGKSGNSSDGESADDTAADLNAKQEAEAKAAADLQAKQEAEAKAAADLQAKQEAEAKAAADLQAKQEAEAKASVSENVDVFSEDETAALRKAQENIANVADGALEQQVAAEVSFRELTTELSMKRRQRKFDASVAKALAYREELKANPPPAKEVVTPDCPIIPGQPLPSPAAAAVTTGSSSGGGGSSTATADAAYKAEVAALTVAMTEEVRREVAAREAVTAAAQEKRQKEYASMKAAAAAKASAPRVQIAASADSGEKMMPEPPTAASAEPPAAPQAAAAVAGVDEKEQPIEDEEVEMLEAADAVESLAASKKTATAPADADATSVSGTRTFEVLMDEMQEANEQDCIMNGAIDKDAVEQESGKRLETIITAIAKMPQDKIKSLVDKYEKETKSMMSDYEPLQETDTLEVHMRYALSSMWCASKGNWERFSDLVKVEVNKPSEDNSKWMQASIAFANEMSDNKLKDLIKKYGTVNAIPKGKRNSVDIEATRSKKGKGRRGGVLKVDYVAALIDTLREKYDNDYRKVFELLQSQGSAAKGTAATTTQGKGFSSSGSGGGGGGGGFATSKGKSKTSKKGGNNSEAASTTNNEA